MMMIRGLRHLPVKSAIFYAADESPDTVRLIMYITALPCHSRKSFHDYFPFLSFLMTTFILQEDMFASVS